MDNERLHQYFDYGLGLLPQQEFVKTQQGTYRSLIISVRTVHVLMKAVRGRRQDSSEAGSLAASSRLDTLSFKLLENARILFVYCH